MRRVISLAGTQASVAIAAGVVALGLVGVALASNPKPGATYAGKIPERLFFTPTKSSRVGRELNKLTVSNNGRRVSTYVAHFATNGCQGGAHNTAKDTGIAIKNGTFADKGSYTVGGFTDHAKFSGDFVRHGKAADVSFRWTTNETGCPYAIEEHGRIHVQ